jgi:hypothetical protein
VNFVRSRMELCLENQTLPFLQEGDPDAEHQEYAH